MIGLGEVPYHTHTGVGSDGPQVDYRDLKNLPATAFPRSFPLTSQLGDTSLNIHTDDIDRIFAYENANQTLIAIGGSEHYQLRDTGSDWADINNIWGVFKSGNYCYVLFQDTDTAPDEWRIYRYAVDDLASGGTQCTFSGTAPDLTVDVNLRMAFDGTYMYLNYDGGNSANAYVIAKYSVSGTAFTYVSSITCGAATLGFNANFAVVADGSIYTIDTTNRNISKFNSGGTLQYTDDANTMTTAHEKFSNIEGTLYCYNNNSKHFEKMFYT